MSPEDVTAIDVEQVRLINEYLATYAYEPMPISDLKWWIPTPIVDEPRVDIEGMGLHQALDQYKRRLIAHALHQALSVRGAAKQLKIARTTLCDTMKALGIARGGHAA